MKLRHLHINNFGHFVDRDLPLPSDGFQVIYGPNEAGKTTLLEFLRGWLFGFPLRSPYDFKSGAEVSGTGTLVLNDGRSVELRRRKGTKNKVVVRIDSRDTDLDEIGFQRLIGHANQSLFESVFAFGLDQLTRGKESLKHESLQSALFGGGLGTVASPEGILLDLDRQAREIFDSNPRRNTTIKATIADIGGLLQQIKGKSLRADEYELKRQAAADADSRATDLNQRVTLMRRDYQRIDKLCRAFPKWAELQKRKVERQPLAVPETLPIDARAQYASIVEKLRTCEDEMVRLTESATAVESDLAALPLDPQAVSFRAEIRACLELKQSFLEAKRDLPKLRTEHAATGQQIDRELGELRPGWSHADLQNFAVDVATRTDMNRLYNEHRIRALSQMELRARRDHLTAQLTRSRSDLGSLGSERDVSILSAILADEPTFLTHAKELESRQNDCARIERLLASRVQRLSPPLGEGRAFLKLPVPPVDTILSFESDIPEVREQLHAALESLKHDEATESQVKSQLEQGGSQNRVPTPDERDAARRRRDAGWALIRRRFIEGHETSWFGSDPRAESDAFENAMRDADELADQISVNADSAARREELSLQLAAISNRLGQKQCSIADLRRRESDLNDRWRLLWQACGIQPLAPDAMRRWMNDHEAACDLQTRRDEATAEIETIRLKIATFEQRLRSAMAATEGDVDALLVTAHHVVDTARDYQRRAKQLQRDVKHLEPQLEQCDQELKTLQDKDASWQIEWQSLLQRLNFPKDWDTELARTVIERLTATRVKLDSLPQDELRLSAMQQRLDEFESRVLPLCQALAPALVREPPDLAAEKLSDQLERAAEAQKHHDQLVRQLETTREQLRQTMERQSRLLAERVEIFVAAEVISEEEFQAVVLRADKLRQVDADLKRLENDIELIRAGEDCEEFERSLRTLEPQALDIRRRDLAQQMQVVEQQKRDADGSAAVAKAELTRMDGSAETALLTETLSHKRAHLSVEIDRYVPLALARHFLADAIRRFDRNHQPEMVQTISRLMNQMTGGRYVEFDRTSHASHEILIRRRDGVERTPEQLSTGTREQLYLAIRLAYVLHYCRHQEPLPIVMDDVLVNFDDERVRQTLTAIAEIAKSVQVLFFTCHRHMIRLAQDVVPGLKPIELAPTGGN